MENPLFLASKSPRRRDLLHQIGVRFSVVDVSLEELRGEFEGALEYVGRLSLSKAQAGADVHIGCATLGADTIVVANGQVLEKPKDKMNAIDMLLSLSAATHSVFTSVSLCLKDQDGNYRQQSIVSRSDVTFRTITEQEVERYWYTGEPRDKAGGYGIQGLGAVFVEHLSGSYSNVVGLPLMETESLLKVFEIPIWS